MTQHHNFDRRNKSKETLLWLVKKFARKERNIDDQINTIANYYGIMPDEITEALKYKNVTPFDSEDEYAGDLFLAIYHLFRMNSLLEKCTVDVRCDNLGEVVNNLQYAYDAFCDFLGYSYLNEQMKKNRIYVDYAMIKEGIKDSIDLIKSMVVNSEECVAYTAYSFG